MEDDIEVLKIKTFLDNFKNEKVGLDGIQNSSADCVENDQIPEYLSDVESKDKFRKLKRSLDSNAECYSVLSSLESSLSVLLEECLKEQRVTKENIEAHEDKKVGDNKFSYYQNSTCIRKNCSSPYFKDTRGFPAKHNEDYNKIRQLGYLNPWNIIKTSNWTEEQKGALEKGIKDTNVRQCKKSVVHPCTSVENISDKPFVAEEIEYDWIKISVTDLNNSRSPQECRAFWINYMHPKINKKGWTEDESKSLKSLVKDYKYQDWESIACDLETSRSAFQCICHFKFRLADICKIYWKDKEILFLSKFVNMCRVRNFIPWNKMAWLMDGRNTSDIYRKWETESGGLTKGTFTLEEDILLVAGLKEFGEDYIQIAEYIPNRNNIQVRSRVMVLRGREGNPGPWTQPEDVLLKKLVDKYGFGNWRKISTHFLNRNNIQIRTRYKILEKMKTRSQDTSSKSILPRLPKTIKGEHSIDDLWETAQKMVQNKRMNNDPNESDSQYSVMYELSQILKPRKKPGRKKGSVNSPSSFNPQFYDLFHSAYIQRGGRGKYTCREEMIPSLVYQIILALRVFNAKIYLPIQKNLIEKDSSMLEMDKSVVSFLVDKKEFVQDNCEFIQFNTGETLEEISNSPFSEKQSLNLATQPEKRVTWYPLCSPNLTTLIGLRTLLLNRVNIKDQIKGLTVQETNTNSTAHFPERDVCQYLSAYLSASKLWHERLGILYTWAGFLSKSYPREQFITVNPDESNCKPKEELKVKTKRKKMSRKRLQGGINNKSVENNGSNEVIEKMKQKRSYVRSGKFAAKSKVIGMLRRNTRLTKVDN